MLESSTSSLLSLPFWPKMAKASHASSSSRSPPIFLCFIILSLVRLSGAAYSIISDCDETFNYWEALHLVLYGNGLETWEYSPPFAIRSWAYILLHGAVAGPLKWAGVSKVSMYDRRTEMGHL